MAIDDGARWPVASFTFGSALHWWRREIPDSIALDVDGETLTFEELAAWSGRVAHMLHHAEGVGEGDFVSAVGINSLDYAVLLVALARIGAIGAPLSFRSSVPEISEAVKKFAPALVFHDAERAEAVRDGVGDKAQALCRDFSILRDLRHGEPVSHDIVVARDAPVFVINTSGSTAKSKSVIYTNYGLMTYACEFVVMEPRCGKGATVLSLGPFSSASGYLLMMQFLATGVTVVIDTKFTPERALPILQEKKVTMMLGVPIFFEQIAAMPGFADADLSSLHFGQVAGAPVSRSLQDKWLEKGVLLRQGYGSSEVGGGWAARDNTALAEPEKAGRGGPFNGFAVMRDDGTFAEPGEVGELVFQGASLMGGYWSDADATTAAMRNGWFLTGDIGKIDAAGNVTFVDRKKDIIISGGLNISAAEVEQAAMACPKVTEVAVIAIKDEKFGETPLAIVHGAATLEADEVIAACRQSLAGYKVPRKIVLYEEPLPRLPSGKIAKPLLRQIYGS